MLLLAYVTLAVLAIIFALSVLGKLLDLLNNFFDF